MRTKMIKDILDYWGSCTMIDTKHDFAINDLFEAITEKRYGIPYDFDRGWYGVLTWLTNAQLRRMLKEIRESGILEGE